ncbi:hypothetical protein [Ahrensia sp. R2A130]|uniref:hypothetical protein n=1 Tax=Ahrensia sp. R2A130 TaxID=744979 RepID=UPI0001E0C2F3|nr:hypothetical protein [Ahrensia sp. R2A130]EFL90196.1 conserved domain protein [Ahrensia sp. R2A130]
MTTLLLIFALLFYPHAAQTALNAEQQAEPVAQKVIVGEWTYYSCDDGAPLYARYIREQPHQYVEIKYDSGPRIRLDSSTHVFGPHFTDGTINLLRKSTGATLTDEAGRLINDCLL